MARTRAIQALCCLCAAMAGAIAMAQNAADARPPAYRGVNTRIDGVFVTPVANAPFSATVQLESKQILQNGATETRKSIAEIARDSQGRIHNERRALVPDSFTETPQVLSIHIYDPESGLSTFLDPFRQLARQSMFGKPRTSLRGGVANKDPMVEEEDLGSKVIENVTVTGRRTSRTLPAAASGTDKPIVVTDEYWYSDELQMNVLIKHSDPRSGEQTVTLTEVNRTEPDPRLFEVPTGYKVVDETPPN